MLDAHMASEKNISIFSTRPNTHWEGYRLAVAVGNSSPSGKRSRLISIKIAARFLWHQSFRRIPRVSTLTCQERTVLQMSCAANHRWSRRPRRASMLSLLFMNAHTRCDRLAYYVGSGVHPIKLSNGIFSTHMRTSWENLGLRSNSWFLKRPRRAPRATTVRRSARTGALTC